MTTAYGTESYQITDQSFYAVGEKLNGWDEIPNVYGKRFTNIVGQDLIYSLKVVQMESFKVDMRHDSAVRGMSGTHPFIGIKLDVLNSEKTAIEGINSVVEKIFMKSNAYQPNPIGPKDRYCLLNSTFKKDKSFPNLLCGNENEIDDTTIQRLKDLLAGNELQSYNNTYYIRMHIPKSS